MNVLCQRYPVQPRNGTLGERTIVLQQPRAQEVVELRGWNSLSSFVDTVTNRSNARRSLAESSPGNASVMSVCIRSAHR